MQYIRVQLEVVEESIKKSWKQTHPGIDMKALLRSSSFMCFVFYFLGSFSSLRFLECDVLCCFLSMLIIRFYFKTQLILGRFYQKQKSQLILDYIVYLLSLQNYS